MCGDYVCSSVYDTFLVPEQTFLKFDMGDINSNLLDNSRFLPYWPIIKPSLHKAINGLSICLINHFADIEIWQGQLALKLVQQFQFSAIFFCIQAYSTLAHEGTFPCVINHFTEFVGIQYERLPQKVIGIFWLSASIIKACLSNGIIEFCTYPINPQILLKFYMWDFHLQFIIPVFK